MQSPGKAFLVVFLGDFVSTELCKMIGYELGVEEGKSPKPQPGDQMAQCDFGCIGFFENMLSPKKAPPSATP